MARVKTSMVTRYIASPSIVNNLKRNIPLQIKSVDTYNYVFDRTFVVKPGKKVCGCPIGIRRFYRTSVNVYSMREELADPSHRPTKSKTVCMFQLVPLILVWILSTSRIQCFCVSDRMKSYRGELLGCEFVLFIFQIYWMKPFIEGMIQAEGDIRTSAYSIRQFT